MFRESTYTGSSWGTGAVTYRSSEPRSNGRKPVSKTEELGQVLTGTELADAMVRGLGLERAQGKIKILDPCVGPATFLKAISRAHPGGNFELHALDVDPEMVGATRGWARDHSLKVALSNVDYLERAPGMEYDYAILNPPYVRQEWIAKKHRYREIFRERYQVDVPGTANLYVYFLVKVMQELRAGGKLACIVYDSWQATKYGEWLRHQIERWSSEVSVVPVGRQPFDGALIDATIIYATKAGTPRESQPDRASTEPKARPYTADLPEMASIESLFSTKRGLRLKQASFFMTDISRATQDAAVPFVKKVGRISGCVVPDDHPEAALLIDGNHKPAKAFRELKRRLEDAKRDPAANVSILTWYSERPDSWATHGPQPWAPILFNYYLRNRPRHLFNPTRVYADNFYGLLPRDKHSIIAWLAALNSTASVVGLLEQARNQGAGLAKLQLYEYRRAHIVDISNWPLKPMQVLARLGADLTDPRKPLSKTIQMIDDHIERTLGDHNLAPAALRDRLAEVDAIARCPR